LTSQRRQRYSFLLPDAAAEWAGAALSDVFPDGLLLHPLPGGVTRLQGWTRAGKTPAPAKLRARLVELGARRVAVHLEGASTPRYALHGRFPVQRLGRFVVVPAALTQTPRLRRDEALIRLVQGQAFGTGLHESTRLMLRGLERLQPEGLELLDVGAGSGILGFAALALGARRVVSVEVEKAACSELRENRALNRVPSRRLPVLHGRFPLARLRGRRWPLVLGNLVTPLLESLMPSLSAALERGGRLLAGGIHTSVEGRRVLAAARAQGLVLEWSRSLRGWKLLCLRRP
jgi:ribosomal protein L11 methylase PrmA